MISTSCPNDGATVEQRLVSDPLDRVLWTCTECGSQWDERGVPVPAPEERLAVGEQQ